MVGDLLEPTGLPEPERERVGGGVLPPLWGCSLPSAVAVHGTEIGTKLERVQVALYLSLRLPSGFARRRQGFMWILEVNDGASSIHAGSVNG